jgi:hypothetical protein
MEKNWDTGIPVILKKSICKWDMYVPLVMKGFTSALNGGGWSTPRPGRFTPGKQTRYPLNRRLVGLQTRSGRVRKISPSPPGFAPRTVQPVASRYTDYAIPAHIPSGYASENASGKLIIRQKSRHPGRKVFNKSTWNERNMNGQDKKRISNFYRTT